jgi:hypothetical protein
MSWVRDIQRHVEKNPKAKVTLSTVTATHSVLNYRAADQAFSVTIDVVEPPMGGRCLSIQTRSGSGVLLDSLLESFDGLFV